jgi:abortive infection bacteriophage resistance protein
MSKVPYTKSALSFPEQVTLLKSRGLIITDEKKAIYCLTHINYYRLSAYIFPFLRDKTNHSFKEGVDFFDIINIYNFDRELRLLILSAIERIEISIKTSIVYVLSQKYDPFWLNNKDLFLDQISYSETIVKLKEEIKRSDELFLDHYFSKYSGSIPPAWIAFEIASFGLVSLLYRNLKLNKDMKEISQRYGLNHIVFSSWLHSLSYVRNVCAHHARLWNRELGVQPSIPKSVGGVWLKNTLIKNDRIFIIITLIEYLLKVINFEDKFLIKLKELFKLYPSIDLAPMGFPKDWESEDLLKTN